MPQMHNIVVIILSSTIHITKPVKPVIPTVELATVQENYLAILVIEGNI